MVSEVKRKSLPAIAKAVGLENHQNLHHFLTESPWQVQQLRQRRLELILKVLKGRSLILLIDETGDCKKGNSTDYVKRQLSRPALYVADPPTRCATRLGG